MLEAPESGAASESRESSGEIPNVGNALQDSLRAITELVQHAAEFVAAKVDQLKLSIRALVLYAILGVIGLVCAAAVLVVSVVLLFVGIAHGIGAVLGGREWLGDLIVGLIVVGGTAISLTFGLNKFKTASRSRTIRKYADRRKQQRERLG